MNWYKRIIIAGLPIYNFRELTKKLKNEFGIQFIRFTKGDDQMWGIPGTNRNAIIPYMSSNRNINPKTMMDILRNLQISVKNFKKKQYKLRDQAPQQQPTEIKLKETPSWQNEPWYQQQQQYATV